MSLRFSLVFLLVLPVLVEAAPWGRPGDTQLKSALEWLADRGCLATPVTTWPIMWSDVQLAASVMTGDCEASQAWEYVRRERDRASHAISGSLSLTGASEAPPMKGFIDQPRERGSVGLTLETRGQYLVLGLSPAFVPEPYDLDQRQGADRWRWDGSYLAAKAGNWVMGIGAVDRWWGPGWRSSLILGSNSRPVPAVFLSRVRAEAFDLPVLRWLGPWTFTAFAGQLEADRVVPHAKLLGVRVAIKPASMLELGFSRTTQWGGDGRPETWSSFRDMLTGHDNYYRDFAQEPGNQLAGVDARFGLPLGQLSSVSFHGQLIGEDEANKLPSRTICQLGAGLSGHWLPGRQELLLEYADTEVDHWRGRSLPNVAYEHHIYQSGYRYHGRSLGAGWDSDSQVASLGLWQFFTSGQALGLTIDHAKINKDGKLRASSAVPPVPVMAAPVAEDLTFYRLDYRQSLWQGRLTLSATWTNRPLKTLAGTWNRTALMASWEYRFEM